MGAQNINIGAAGNVQIGNDNTINGNVQIQHHIHDLIKAIDKSDSSVEQKEQAKSLLMRFVEHPLVSGLINGPGIDAIRSALGV